MFSSSLGKLLIGAAVSQGTSYIKDEYFSGSFLDKGLKSIGQTFGINKFFDNPVAEGAFNVAKKAAPTVIEQMLGQGLGIDPRSGQNMPTINVPEGDTFRSSALPQQARNYGGFPQGSRRILENAFQDARIQDMAMQYTQARLPNLRVVEPTVRLSGLGALGKGQIKSIKT